MSISSYNGGMKNSSWLLQYQKATVTKQVNQQPYSVLFDDVYFNDLGGLAETQYVFIEHNQLVERWIKNTNQALFCIGETGFGTGLNFLTTLQAWQNAPNKPQKLHFISCEKFPLSFHDMKKAHLCFPELQAFSQLLLSIWHSFDDVFRNGLHSFDLINNVTLTLAFGDASDNLNQLKASVDAWYLDGFAPNKNPDMWDEKLLTAVAGLSRIGSTLSTFTAASGVSKVLKNVGFEVAKKSGFGKKREMITAQFKQHKKVNNQYQWYPTPKTNTQKLSVTILGGGIAGMCLAHYFKQSNYHVTVIDQYPTPLQVASGNHLAMVMPLITAQQSPESSFYVRAFETALNFYTNKEFHAIGVHQKLIKTKLKQWGLSIKRTHLPKHLVQITNDCGAIYPTAGYVDNTLVAERLQSNVDQWLTAEVDQLFFNELNQWQLKDKNNTWINDTELLIIANGIKAQQLLKPIDLSLLAKHGMTSTIKPTSNTQLEQIQLGEGYIIPNPSNNYWQCGATFDHMDETQWYNKAILHDNHWQRNLKLWQGMPIYDHLQQAQIKGGFAAIRATTPDHLPICGPVIDQKKFKSDYHDLHHGRHWQHYPPARPMKNLYTLNGLGSRGFTSAPLLAKYLHAMIAGEPLPLEADLCKIIHPNRFLYRNLKRPPKTENKQQ